MDEFINYSRADFIGEILRLRKEVAEHEESERNSAWKTDEITRLLNREAELQAQLVAADALRRDREAEVALQLDIGDADLSRLKEEVEAQKWAATRHQNRAEAFQEVIAMMLGGAK